MKDRVVGLDVAKGVAILLVVVCHTGAGILNAGLGVVPLGWEAFYSACYAFMVPVFFCLSGWFNARSRKGLRRRLVYLAATIVYPYLLWSLLQTVLMIVTQAGNRQPEWSDLPGIMLFGWMQFWFLHALILILLWDVLMRWLRVRGMLRLVLALLLSGMALWLEAWPRVLGEWGRHLIYFELAVWLAGKGVPQLGRVGWMLMGGLGLTVLVALEGLGIGYGSDWRVFAAFAGVLACLVGSVLIANGVPWLSKGLAVLGSASLGVYILHVIFAAGMRVILAKLGVEGFWLHMLVGCLVGVGLPLIAWRLDGLWGGGMFVWRRSWRVG